MTGGDQTVLVSRDAQGIATITLNLPQQLNPLSEPLQRALRDALAQLRADAGVRVLVLAGAGRAFSAGAELSGLRTDPDSLRRAADLLDELTMPLIHEVATMPMPVMAVVHGPAAGGGVGLALAADIVVAARSAYFYLPFMPALGIVPDLGTSWFLPRAIGRARSMGLALTGDRLPAERAAQWGLIWDCVDDDQLGAQSAALARKLARLPRHAIAELRAAHAQSARNDLPAQLAWEASRQRELITRDEFAEGVRAFREKRAPDFHQDRDR